MALSSMQNMSLCCGASPPPPRATKAQGMWDVYSAKSSPPMLRWKGNIFSGGTSFSAAARAMAVMCGSLTRISVLNW